MPKSKTVLITGAAKRVGRELALFFARDGWNVALHYHRSRREAEALAREIESLGSKAYTLQADLEDAESVSSLIPSLGKKGVALDCLINNASAFEKDSLATLKPALWQTHMSVNFFAPLQLMRDFASHYKGDAGNVINLTDGLEGWSMSANFLSYTLSKQGLAHATALLARELAPRIRVNAVAPGATLPSKHDVKDPFAGSQLEKIIPLARMSSPSEIADTIRYILNAPSLTGQVLSLSGGADRP